MTKDITIINLGGVNCYLIGAGTSFILIDTGFSNKRGRLLKELENAGCQSDNLQLILLTHGDIDHAANAAYLHKKFGATIGMHLDDSGMVETGNMGWNRKSKPDKISFIGGMIILFGSISTFLSPSNKFETFSPDFYCEDGQSLFDYGLDACVIHIPGHSKGSIAVLTASGDLFCGDLLWNIGKPGPHFLVDDLIAHQSSMQKLKSLKIKTVYPGHGNPFSIEKLLGK